ncbi:hypothetical protein C0Q70_17945 [Pomacea canaliculata]|uniref:Uncharacterized protein n=1 Tax=Pomacea canaliculata TaxID=400727 RepID=A0A2T7NLU8_POMCA|nr:tetratricopeptide repeat protein 16-like isoform X2 [Pomacea canaliculata]PVD22140.1 hypothetical protein C0Q70_17945 [Pomacea canaliculata]
MASKPEKVKKVKSSATLDRDEELSRKSSMESSGGDNPGLVQRSATRDILDFSEDSYVSGDARGESPFRVEASDYHQDPMMVNVHQFYPIIDQSFRRGFSGRLGEEKTNLKAISEEEQHDEKTGKEAILGECDNTENTTDVPGDGTSSEDTNVDQRREKVESQSDLSSRQELLEVNTEDSQGLGSSGLTEDPQVPVSSGMFYTMVDEDTIQAARQRKKTTFAADEWSEIKNATYSLADIVAKRAYEHYQRALHLKSQQQWLEMITCLTKAISLKGDEAAFYRQRGEAFIQLCDFHSAILNYKKACLLDSSSSASYQRLAFLFYFYGQCLFDQRLFAEALEAFSRAAEMNPDNIGYHMRSISCLAALQRHGECLALVNKRLEKDSTNPDLYVMRARLHDMFGNSTLCYYDVKDALAVDADHQEAKEMMHRLELKAAECKTHCMHLNLTGKYREALQKISIAIETNPSMAEYHVLRGALHRKLNDFNAAIDDFLLALDKCDHNEEDPVYSKAQRQLLLTYNDFAVECFNKNFFEEAIVLLNKAVKGEKNEKGLYINRGDCFFKQSELNFALQDYLQALELDESDTAIATRISVIYNEFGVGLYQDKKYTEAEAKFSQALQFNPRIGQYYISRSRARYMLGNLTGARQDLLLGLLLDPFSEDILSILARLFPGKSVADVVSSPAATVAKNTIQQLEFCVHPSSPRQEVTIPERSEFKNEVEKPKTPDTAPAWNPTACFPPLKLCMKEKEFNLKLVQEKQKVEQEVKDILQNRGTLQYQGGRIQPLPPPCNETRYGGKLQGSVSAVPAIKQNKKSTSWRNFGLGIGLQ